MPPQPAGEFRGTDRFRMVRRLGAGGMGVVSEAHDLRHDARVAIKTLANVSPDAIYQLKSEFRTIAGVTHPNLVTLYELHAAEDVWFITMEIVDGRPFSEFVRGPAERELVSTAEPGVSAGPDEPTRTRTGPVSAGEEPSAQDPSAGPRLRARTPACDLDRLFHALPQLVDGIRAIHAAGKLHRDLKPSNVLVTAEGRVVILDFGIAADLGRRQAMETTNAAWAGTPRYMAPEQFTDAPLDEATDWYAMGIMLYEALTGEPSFRGPSVAAMALEKAVAGPDPPSAWCDGVPPDLDALCRDLLRPDPVTRPTGEMIARRIAGITGNRIGPPEMAALAPHGASVLVGRQGALAEIERARAMVRGGFPVAVFVRGRSGMGKSAVLQAFLDTCASEPGTVVLSGRCFEAESVPFKALDALVDSLARYLQSLQPADIASLLPRRADALARMFPALLRVPAFADAPQGRSAVKDAVEERQVASVALGELVGRLGDRSPLIVAIDDLQWGDLDSAVLLGELLSAPDPPPLLLLLAVRSEQADSSVCVTHLRQPGRPFRSLDVDLSPLTGADVQELQVRLHADAGPLASERAARIAAAANGNPFLIREALDAGADVQAGQEAVAGKIREKVAKLDDPSRRLVEIVSLSAKPLEVSRACEAADTGGDTLRILARLRGLRLVRSGTAGERDTLETYHDRIRETVAASLGADERRAVHARIADVLGRQSPVDAEHLALHLEGAGRTGDASALYAAAAHQASQALAFDHAVTLYERAIRLRGDREDATLTARFAEALAEAGRSAEAADRFAESARLAGAEERREYSRRAAYYYCISGRIDQGKAALGEVLGHFGIGLPRSTGAAIASVLAARARLWMRGLDFRERSPGDLPLAERERLDSLWAAAIGLGNTEVIRGIGFSARGLLEALNAGDPARIVRALCWEACLRAVNDVRSAERLIGRAEAILPSCDTPYLRGMLSLARAIHAINVTHFREAVPLFDEAEGLWLEHGHGVDWEINTARHFCSWAMLYAGEFAEARRRMTRQQREAAERGNLYMTVSMGAYAEPLAMLAADQLAGARARRAAVMALWTERHFNVQHVLAMLAEIQALLYEGDGSGAIAAARRQRAAARAHGFDRLEMGRVSTDYLTVNAAFLAVAQGGPAPALLKEAGRAIRQLSREPSGWAGAAAQAGRAGLALAQGDQAAAARHLEEADARYTAIGMTGYACAARRARGLMIGGDLGRALVGEADSWLAAHGVVAADPFCRVLVHVPIPEAWP